MAKLERPLYSDEATGVYNRLLAYRRSSGNPSVARLPSSHTPPSSLQQAVRLRYKSAVAAWNAMTPAEKQPYFLNRPSWLSGFNFFLRLYFSSSFFYFFYSTFGTAFFMLSPDPDQPSQSCFSLRFPNALDQFPILQDGAHSIQAWFFNHAFSSIIGIEQFLLDNKAHIEG